MIAKKYDMHEESEFMSEAMGKEASRRADQDFEAVARIFPVIIRNPDFWFHYRHLPQIYATC